MKAPSEKHLEDWIVANPEKVLPEGRYISYGVWGPLIEKIVKRQPKLPNGIPDLIFKTDGIGVLELKKGTIKPDTVTQCLRYMADLRDIGYTKHIQHTLFTPINLPIPEFETGDIRGFVMGYQIQDDNLLLACSLLNITVITYDFDGVNYQFCNRYKTSDIRNQAVDDWADGAIGEAMLEVMKERLIFNTQQERLRKEHSLNV